MGISAANSFRKHSAYPEKRTYFAARLSFFLTLAALCLLAPHGTREAVREVISEAYISVSTFVAGTLILFYLLEQLLKVDTDALLEKHENLHIPISAFMGALPGCGGAIMIITQYACGRIGFGSVVATLCSTMGDAAFLLLAQRPSTALFIYAISMFSGIACGYFVRFVHGRDFLRRKKKSLKDFFHTCACGMPSLISPLRTPWLVIMVPGLALGIGNAFQADTDAWFGPLSGFEPTMWYGLLGAMLSVSMWVMAPNAGPSVTNLRGTERSPNPFRCMLDQAAVDTNFVTVWVVLAFLVYELPVLWLDIDLAVIFDAWRPVLPLLAIFVGFIPGCGPQILVTTMYLNGLVPLSVQIGNAISNDGDALFPAIALAPKAALLATVYTAVPALLFAYGWYFFVET